jgi:large subunit ribosomal protein L11
MFEGLDIKHKKILYLQSQSVEAAPPLGTILGNLGVNTVKFCEEFNKYTNKLPSYFVIKTSILIYENRSFSFQIDSFSITYAIKLLKFSKTIKILHFDRYNDKIINCIYLKDLLHLLVFKFPKEDLKKSFLIILGVLRSMKILVTK